MYVKWMNSSIYEQLRYWSVNETVRRVIQIYVLLRLILVNKL